FKASDAKAPVLIWFHGNAGNLTDRAEMAAEIAKRGVSVFVFDWRGYGRSEGRASESGLFRDALGAFDFVQAMKPTSIVLYGESLGGPYAAFAAKERKGAHAVIIENSFPSLMALGNALYKLGWTAPFALRTSKWLNEAGVPVLVMHGTRDAVIPYSLGKQLYDELRVPKELLTADAGHCEIPRIAAGRYYDAVIKFAK
ncbi:MAG TPA: alpha/beta fold hydrolase, partial [Thermoanaerobaculia bacterium]|nr:alpha/beta fold hydrolase [Thermoanaerobaculia bacterium]